MAVPLELEGELDESKQWEVEVCVCVTERERERARAGFIIVSITAPVLIPLLRDPGWLVGQKYTLNKVVL